MSTSNYSLNTILSWRILTVIGALLSLVVSVDAGPAPHSSVYKNQKCKELDVSFEVIQDVNSGTKSSIKIDLKEVKSDEVIISLVGPKKIFLQDVQEREIRNLNKGTYSLVVVGKEESSGYCPTTFQVIIK